MVHHSTNFDLANIIESGNVEQIMSYSMCAKKIANIGLK